MYINNFSIFNFRTMTSLTRRESDALEFTFQKDFRLWFYCSSSTAKKNVHRIATLAWVPAFKYTQARDLRVCEHER